MSEKTETAITVTCTVRVRGEYDGDQDVPKAVLDAHLAEFAEAFDVELPSTWFVKALGYKDGTGIEFINLDSKVEVVR